jgi:putative copper export protein
MDNLFTIFLRIIHIFGGAFWAGGSLFMVGVLTPTVNEAGAEGAKFMQRLAGGSRMSPLFGGAALATLISGILLYIKWGMVPGWIVTPTGLALTIGALAGIAAYGHGLAVQGRASLKLSALGKTLAAQSGPPTPAQLAEIQTLRGQLERGAVQTTILLSVAMLGMAIFEYMKF